jgi:hypothetical protein
MKIIAVILFLSFTALNGNSQTTIEADSTELPSHSIRIIAKVKSADYDYMTLVVENVVEYSRGAGNTPQQGDEITVRLPGRSKPQNDTRIEADLKESIELGAVPSSYIALDFRTIE